MSPHEFCLWHCSAASLKPCAVKKDNSSALPLPSALKSGGSPPNHEKGSTVRFLKGNFPIWGTVDFLGRFFLEEGKLLSS